MPESFSTTGAARAIEDSKAAGERLRLWKMSLLNRASAAADILEELRSDLVDLLGAAGEQEDFRPIFACASQVWFSLETAVVSQSRR